MCVKREVLYQFDDFEADPYRRQLTRAGVPVPVPQKVLQLLLFFLEHPMRVLSKRELMEGVWPQAFVEDANLTQSVFLLRKALGEQPGRNRYVVTVPGEGYQFAMRPHVVELPRETLPATAADNEAGGHIADANVDGARAPLLSGREAPVAAARPPGKRMRLGLALAVSLLILLVCLGVWQRQHKPAMKISGNLVLAEFNNATGDKAFDAALRQGLAAQLEQSPELGVLSDVRIAQTLTMMAQPRDIRLTPDLATQVCIRTGSAATVEGSISTLGQQYVLGVKALNCTTGDTLALDQEVAPNKEQVLTTLGTAAGKLRRKLGESLTSLQKHDTALADVTTGSLSALEAYSLGVQAQDRGDCAAAIAHFKRAIGHDPDFAMAYSHIGVCDTSEEGVNATRRAYELRSRVSDREQYYLTSHYEQYATGNLTAARKVLEAWSVTYPHDSDPAPNLLKLYLTTGEYERALPLVQDIVKNSPGTPGSNAARLATTLMFLNRIDEAKKVLLDAIALHHDGPVHHFYLYEIDFLQNDSASMASEAAFVRAQPGWESNMLDLESVSARYFGKFALARSLSDKAVQADLRDQNLEDAAGTMADAALQEAAAGNKLVAGQKARASLALSRSSGVESSAGMALALAGDAAGAMRIIADIDHRFPADTIAQASAATMRACVLLGTQSSPTQAHRAIEALAPAAPYAMSGILWMVPMYVRGQAHLAEGDGEGAAADFQAILDHPGVTRNYVTGPLARLGLARAEAKIAKQQEARADYAEFLRLWRDADQNVTARKLAKQFAK